MKNNIANTLREDSKNLRKKILILGNKAGNNGAHLGPALSMVEVMVVLYKEIMNYNIKNYLEKHEGVMSLTDKSTPEEIDEIFKTEISLYSITNLASITIKLPKSNVEQSGIYYFILKQLAWADIPVQEVISTTHEITIVVKETDIKQAFSILMDMKLS